MTRKNAEKKAQVVLTDDGPGQVRVDLEAFFEFSFYMAEELEDLVAEWLHTAAPKSNRGPQLKR